MCFYTYKWILFLSLLCCVNSENGTPCKTIDKKPGICTRSSDCQILTDMLLDSKQIEKVRSYVRNSSCVKYEETSSVCCPQQESESSAIHFPIDDMDQHGEFKMYLPAPACGFSNASMPRVYRPFPAYSYQYPWIVALGYGNDSFSQPEWLCEGSLITHIHVLTAAHCVHNKSNLFIARIRDLNLFSDIYKDKPTDISIESIYSHEEYVPHNAINDIAILTLSHSTEDMGNVWPICLPWKTEIRSQSYIDFNLLVGWREQEQTRDFTFSALKLSFNNVKPNTICQDNNLFAMDNQSIFCVDYSKGVASYGGPLMYGVSSPKAKFVQLYLLGIGSAFRGNLRIYTRVTEYLDWIVEHL